MTRAMKYVTVIAVQVAVLVLLIAREEHTLKDGRPVELRVEPFDPIDPLSGRFVQVRLEIDHPSVEIFEANRDELKQGASVYVLLDTNADPAEVSSVRSIPPNDDSPFLKATVRSVDVTQMHLDYGLERFFIPKDAKDPTRPRDSIGNMNNVRLLVKIDKSGHAVTQDLLVNGVPFAEWNR